MKVKPIKDFLWTHSMPLFEKDKKYDVKDSIGDEMIKHGYAVLVDKLESRVTTNNHTENKMIDISSKPKRVKMLSLKKKIKKDE